MSPETVTLAAFLNEAAAVLAQVEQNLRRLERAALFQYQQALSAGENGSGPADDSSAQQLLPLSRQFAALSERSQSLQSYLQQGLTTPPVEDDHWPRIRILQSQEEERTQWARELEKGIGQLLANAVFELASCRNLLGPPDEAVTSGLDALQTELEAGLAYVRQMIIDLEPATILANFGLGAGVRRYLEQFEARTGVKTGLQVKTNLGRLPSVIEGAIFRVIREALRNVELHARASQVEVLFEEENGQLHFTVRDDGEGLTPEKVGKTRKSLGLARMVDYAELLNGRLRMFSEPGCGTRVVLSIPYPRV